MKQHERTDLPNCARSDGPRGATMAEWPMVAIPTSLTN